MSQQTINVGAAPNDGTGTPLRTAFQYTNSNFTELYTAVGPSGNNIVVPGNATISGDLTVATSALKVVSASNRVLINQSAAIQGDSLEITAKSNAGAISLFGRAADNSSVLAFRSNGSATQKATVQGGDYGLQLVTGTTSRLTIDSTGIFTFENVGGVAGTAMTLNSTGLGVGQSPSAKLSVNDANGIPLRIGDIAAAPASQTACYVGMATSALAGATNGDLVLIPRTSAANSITFWTGNGTAAERFRIDSSGNVGVGVTPSAWSGFGAPVIQMPSGGTFVAAGSTNIACNFYYSGGQFRYIASSTASYYQQNSGQHIWYNAPSGTAGNAITFTQAMTLDAIGNLLVGTTSTSNTTQGFKILSTGRFYGVMATGGYAIMNHTGGSGTEYIYEFQRAGTAVGSITTTTTSTAYVTSSDYRLKESVAPLSGGLARVNALKPSIYKWKSDGSSGEGFLAHELAEVVPSAVTGEKDAVNEDGSIKAQGVDLSKVVPILVAAIKELTARVEALEA